ncbi:unnamed protein product, partial [Didymodactylos carnosus]
DLAQFSISGELTFSSRRDFQIKLRGQRIEVGEIENVILASLNCISDCVVTKQHDDIIEEDYLIAYIITSNKTMIPELETHVKQFLQLNVPSYMIPSTFMILDKLPLNSNGKINRKKLPQPGYSTHKAQHHNGEIP